MPKSKHVWMEKDLVHGKRLVIDSPESDYPGAWTLNHRVDRDLWEAEKDDKVDGSRVITPMGDASTMAFILNDMGFEPKTEVTQI